jgi:hypothetical protein
VRNEGFACPTNMDIIEQPRVCFDEDSSIGEKVKEAAGEFPKGFVSTRHKIVRGIFVAAETAAIFVTVILYIGWPGQSGLFVSIPLVLLPFASVAMLCCRFWMAGLFGLVTTAALFLTILNSGFIRVC